MQTDFGQHHDDAKALINAHHAWAEAHHPDWVMGESQQVQCASDLGRGGHHLRDPDYDADDARQRHSADQ